MRRVVVTGIGLLTPLGWGREISWNRILAGQSGAGRITAFDPTDYACQVACEVPRVDGRGGGGEGVEGAFEKMRFNGGKDAAPRLIEAAYHPGGGSPAPGLGGVASVSEALRRIHRARGGGGTEAGARYNDPNAFYDAIIKAEGTAARGGDPYQIVAACRGAGLRVLAADPYGDAELYRCELAAPTAWLFGSEAHGLPAELAAVADARVRVPIHGRAESLNLAAAAAVCLYASARAQRG